MREKAGEVLGGVSVENQSGAGGRLRCLVNRNTGNRNTSSKVKDAKESFRGVRGGNDSHYFTGQ